MICLNKKVVIGFMLLLSTAAMLFGFASYANEKMENASIIKSIDDISCQKNRPDCLHKNDGDIIIDGIINWSRNQDLILYTKGNIIFKQHSKFIIEGSGSFILKSGMNPIKVNDEKGTIIFDEENTQIEVKGSGKVKAYYNPKRDDIRHKYHNGKSFTFGQHVKSENIDDAVTTYMLVNDVQDLQDIDLFLSGKYALSRDIDATSTKTWNNGQGFKPLYDKEKDMPFSGDIDGNGYTISGLFINRPNEEKVGLIGDCSGFKSNPNKIENLILAEFNITGDHYVGTLAGRSIYTDISNVSLIDPSVVSIDIAGGLIGATYKTKILPVTVYYKKHFPSITAHKYKGIILGTANESEIHVIFNISNINEQEENIDASPYDTIKRLTTYKDKIPKDNYLGNNNKSRIVSEMEDFKDSHFITGSPCPILECQK